MQVIRGKIVDIVNRRIFSGELEVIGGKITNIREKEVEETHYVLPGFIDAHIHIESSMLPPAEFARLAVLHGTVATVSDPHEIGNVLGMEGIRFMWENAQDLPFSIFFGASPCVPATAFETAGATIAPEDIRTLFTKYGFKYLSEVMNFPGVLAGDPDMMAKLGIAKELGRAIDGHAPGLRGEKAKKYSAHGITTDHECVTLEEALDKIGYGMKILIREGSAAKNFAALHPLLKLHPDKVMFCSDDKHPNELAKGHIDEIVRRAVALGYDLFDVLRAASLHPNRHYKLGLGELQVGDPADFIVVTDLKTFAVEETYIRGKKVAERGKTLIPAKKCHPINQFSCSPKKKEDFPVGKKPIIGVVPGELITKKLPYEKGIDCLKLTVVNRYRDAPPAVALVKGFGLKEGALASSVAHDSHNIVAVGVDDLSLCEAVNAVIGAKGGIAAVQKGKVDLLPLPIGGLMSDQEGFHVAREYEKLKEISLAMGSTLPDPFMALSFLALLVIPSLKLSDKGLFDADTFTFA